MEAVCPRVMILIYISRDTLDQLTTTSMASAGYGPLLTKCQFVIKLTDKGGGTHWYGRPLPHRS